MPEEKQPLLIQTKTRTKVLIGIALAVIIGGIIVAAAVSRSSKTVSLVCQGGARDGQKCRYYKDCPAVATGAPIGKCVKTASNIPLPNLKVSSFSFDPAQDKHQVFELEMGG